jgi:hypothetical protein
LEKEIDESVQFKMDSEPTGYEDETIHCYDSGRFEQSPAPCIYWIQSKIISSWFTNRPKISMNKQDKKSG